MPERVEYTPKSTAPFIKGTIKTHLYFSLFLEIIIKSKDADDEKASDAS